MRHETTTPFRFRTPPGWPTPSDDWVRLHQAAEPPAGWSPAPEVPSAPAEWVFWRTVPRVFRSYLPAGARRLRLAQRIGLVVALVSFVAVLVVAALGGPAVIGLAPLVAGLAVVVVTASRHVDLGARTAASIRDDAAAWRHTELPVRAAAARPDLGAAEALAAWEAAAWGLPVARPLVTTPSLHPAAPAGRSSSPSAVPASFRRSARLAFGVTAGAAAFLLVVGATAVGAPVVQTVQAHAAGQTLAHGLQGDDGSDPGSDPAGPSAGPEDGSGADDSSTWTSDDGATTATFIGDDDGWRASCGAIDFTDGCWAWEIDSECDGPATITMGFSDSVGGDDVRTDTRTVQLDSRYPLVFTEQGTEDYSGIEDVTCDTTSKSPVGTTKTLLDSDEQDADGSWPDGCVDFGCSGWELTSETDCASATVQFAVDEEVASLPGPHELVVTTPLRAGQPVDVWAAGTWSSDDDATLESVTCG